MMSCLFPFANISYFFLFFLGVFLGHSAVKTESSTLSSHDTKDDPREMTRPSRPAVRCWVDGLMDFFGRHCV